MELLFIRLTDTHAPEPYAQWALWRGGRKEAASLAPAPVEELSDTLPEAEEAREVVLIVPGQDVLLVHADVPPKQARHLKTIAPFLVEEQLAEDIAQQHVAHGALKDARVQVAVAQKKRMAQWKTLLEGAGMAARVIVPETLLVPEHHGSWHVMCDGESAWLHAGEAGLYAMDAGAVAQFLPLLLQKRQAAVQPLDCTLFGAAQTNGAAQALMPLQQAFPQLTIGVKNGDNVMDVFCETYLTLDAPLNLLQGEFAAQAPVISAGDWRRLARIGLAWGVAMLGITAAQASYFSYKTQALQAASGALYRETFPEDAKVVDPVAQMKARLGGGQGVAGGFLPLLDRLAEAWQPGPNDPLQLEDMAYDDDAQAMTLNVVAPRIDSINALAQQLAAAGLSANVLSVVSDRQTVKGQIAVRSAP